MLSKTDPSESAKGSPFQLLEARTDAIAKPQRELLEAYEQASRAWLARVQSELDLWAGLAAKLPKTRSVPEAMQAYQECISPRMQMAAEDGRRLSEDCQKVMSRHPWPMARSRDSTCERDFPP